MKQDMTQDMKHNDMKRNNEMRDTMSATRKRHGICSGEFATRSACSGGFAIRNQRVSGFAIL